MVREAIMRRDISFKTTDGTTLRGWHYRPDGARPYPTIVLAHGFSAVKEMYLDKYAEAFVKAGLASVVYDNRGFGESDGDPRQEIDPWLQIRDYSDAITFCWQSRANRQGKDRNLGIQLQWRARLGCWRDRSQGTMRCVAGPGD
jgi:alpha-beta hydrolase superfamily lysophospholipase